MSETHWKKLTNPNYLGSWDFKANEERILTISKVVREEVFNPSDNSKKACIVAYFNENCKPMILNKTNCKTIQGLYNTPIIEKWAGCSIIVRAEKVKAFGKLEDGLRIKKQLPAKSKNSLSQNVPQCHDCAGAISDIEGYSKLQIVAETQKHYGVPLCATCGTKRKARKDEPDAPNT